MFFFCLGSEIEKLLVLLVLLLTMPYILYTFFFPISIWQKKKLSYFLIFKESYFKWVCRRSRICTLLLYIIIHCIWKHCVCVRERKRLKNVAAHFLTENVLFIQTITMTFPNEMDLLFSIFIFCSLSISYFSCLFSDRSIILKLAHWLDSFCYDYKL